MINQTTHPLAGVKVIAVEQYIAGPFCTMLMADAGAEVIKIERPGQGDPRRGMSPIYTDKQGNSISGGFIEYNRNKKSMTLDLKNKKAQAIFIKLIKNSDIIVENFRPGVMDRLGLGYDNLTRYNPGLVYVAISGFGQLKGFEGPYSDRPAFDIVAEAMSGYMHMIGHEDEPPQNSIYGLADLVSSWVAFGGAMMALYNSKKTGQGRFVDVSMYDAMTALNERALLMFSLTGDILKRGPERFYGPRGAFKAKDGFIVLNIPSDYMWERLAKVVGGEQLAQDSRFEDGISRASNREILRNIIERWSSLISMEEAVNILLANGVPAAEVQTAEDVYKCPHLNARKLLVDIEHPVIGKKKMVGSPIRISNTPQAEISVVPELGEHTVNILDSLGYSSLDIELLKQDKII